ncbi:unnamed protein product, partial [Didymodactylos carnosus]
LEFALKPAVNYTTNLLVNVADAVQCSEYSLEHLTVDEAAAIRLYTLEWPNRTPSVYSLINEGLRGESHETIRPWLGYLKLLITALENLPSVSGLVYRGVKENLSQEYSEGTKCIWWAVSSCTESIKVLEQFLGRQGPRTIFIIQCIKGKVIRQHSYFQQENEIVLPPGTQLHVIGQLSPADDLYIIHMQEVQHSVPNYSAQMMMANFTPQLHQSTSKEAEQLIKAIVAIKTDKPITSNGEHCTVPTEKWITTICVIFLEDWLTDKWKTKVILTVSTAEADDEEDHKHNTETCK